MESKDALWQDQPVPSLIVEGRLGGSAITVEELNADLNPDGKYPYHLSSAVNGDGVFETLKAVAKQVLYELRRR